MFDGVLPNLREYGSLVARHEAVWRLTSLTRFGQPVRLGLRRLRWPSAAVALRRWLPLPPWLTALATITFIVSLWLGWRGLWKNNGYLVNLLSSVTGFSAALLLGAPALDYLTSRAQWVRTRPSRRELAEEFVEVTENLTAYIADVLYPADSRPWPSFSSPKSFRDRAQELSKTCAILSDGLQKYRFWLDMRSVDRLEMQSGLDGRIADTEVVELAKRISRDHAYSIWQSVTELNEVWLAEIVTLRTDRQQSLGRLIANVRRSARQLPTAERICAAANVFVEQVERDGSAAVLERSPGEEVLNLWTGALAFLLPSLQDLTKAMAVDP